MNARANIPLFAFTHRHRFATIVPLYHSIHACGMYIKLRPDCIYPSSSMRSKIIDMFIPRDCGRMIYGSARTRTELLVLSGGLTRSSRIKVWHTRSAKVTTGVVNTTGQFCTLLSKAFSILMIADVRGHAFYRTNLLLNPSERCGSRQQALSFVISAQIECPRYVVPNPMFMFRVWLVSAHL